MGVREAISTQNHVLFGVLEETSLGCAQCGRVNKSWEQFLTLRVQYQQGVENSVQRFVDSFGQGARHDVEAVCTLQGCGAVGARYRQQRLLRVGEYIVFLLTVYDMGQAGYPRLGGGARIRAEPTVTVRGRSYRLVGAVEHVGRSLSSGHYLSYRRQAGGLWRALNDDGVSNQASGLRHGTILTSQELAGRQLYVCVYALDDSAQPAPAGVGGGGDAARERAERRRQASWEEVKRRAVEARERARKAEEERRRKQEEEARRKKAEEEAERAAAEARRKNAEAAKEKEEEARRRKAEEEAQRKEAEGAKKKEEEARRRKAEEEAKRTEAEGAKKKEEEARRRKVEEEARRQGAEDAKKAEEEKARAEAEARRKKAEKDEQARAEEARRKEEEEKRKKHAEETGGGGKGGHGQIMCPLHWFHFAVPGSDPPRCRLCLDPPPICVRKESDGRERVKNALGVVRRAGAGAYLKIEGTGASAQFGFGKGSFLLRVGKVGNVTFEGLLVEATALAASDPSVRPSSFAGRASLCTGARVPAQFGAWGNRGAGCSGQFARGGVRRVCFEASYGGGCGVGGSPRGSGVVCNICVALPDARSDQGQSRRGAQVSGRADPRIPPLPGHGAVDG